MQVLEQGFALDFGQRVPRRRPGNVAQSEVLGVLQNLATSRLSEKEVQLLLPRVDVEAIAMNISGLQQCHPATSQLDKEKARGAVTEIETSGSEAKTKEGLRDSNCQASRVVATSRRHLLAILICITMKQHSTKPNRVKEPRTLSYHLGRDYFLGAGATLRYDRQAWHPGVSAFRFLGTGTVTLDNHTQYELPNRGIGTSLPGGNARGHTFRFFSYGIRTNSCAAMRSGNLNRMINP